MAKYEKNRSTRRSTPRHPIAMASTAKPPDPMPCALAAILLPESSAPACHMRKTLFPGTFWVHAGCGCVRAVPACGVCGCCVGARRETGQRHGCGEAVPGDAGGLEEWPKSAPFFFSATLLAVLNPSFFWGVQMEFSIQNEINSFHLYVSNSRSSLSPKL